MTDEKPKRKWQNLLHQRCPNCGSKLETSGMYLICPTPHPTEKERNCFFIKKDKAVELLLDTEHPANICLSIEDREMLDDIIKLY